MGPNSPAPARKVLKNKDCLQLSTAPTVNFPSKINTGRSLHIGRSYLIFVSRDSPFPIPGRVQLRLPADERSAGSAEGTPQRHVKGVRGRGAAPLSPQWPHRLLGDSLVRFGGWPLPYPTGTRKDSQRLSWESWRSMSRLPGFERPLGRFGFANRRTMPTHREGLG
jgi:hypothetical protein